MSQLFSTTHFWNLKVGKIDTPYCPTSGVQRRSALRSANQAELLVPRSRTTIKQRRSFSVAGPTTWNGLPVALRLVPRGHTTTFFVNLKTVLFSRGWTGSASE